MIECVIAFKTFLFFVSIEGGGDIQKYLLNLPNVCNSNLVYIFGKYAQS